MRTLLVFVLLAISWGAHAAPPRRSPNIVVIYADDLGYGDVGAYGATLVKTPRMDALAKGGLRFTDAYAAAATCTPSRYALLTGEYAFRKKGTGILASDAALIIQPGRPTLPSMLKQAGYTTGIVGKWHLGLGTGKVDWNGEIGPGPLDVGFDESFIMPATGDRVPSVYVEGRRVVGLDPKDPLRVSYERPLGAEPTGKKDPALLRVQPSHGHDQAIVNGISRIGYMTGGTAALWKDEDLSDVITTRATTFIERHRERPFFLFFSLHDPHVPRAPHPRFAGKSGCGVRCDAIAQLDDSVGRLLDALDRLKLRQDTLIVLTSDNGPVLDDGYRDGAVEQLNGHKPAGALRGGKYSAFEAGTRVPFVVNWPGRVKPGRSSALVGQVDLFASLAKLVNQPLPEQAGADTRDVSAALLGRSPRGRDELVLHAGVLALRSGRWKYIEPGSGPPISKNTGIETGQSPVPQLYDLARDPGETRNLAEMHPERVAEMQRRLDAIRAKGRSS